MLYSILHAQVVSWKRVLSQSFAKQVKKESKVTTSKMGNFLDVWILEACSRSSNLREAQYLQWITWIERARLYQTDVILMGFFFFQGLLVYKLNFNVNAWVQKLLHQVYLFSLILIALIFSGNDSLTWFESSEIC
jgi:hypothetical protein